MNRRSQEKVEKKKMLISFQVLTRANYFNEVVYVHSDNFVSSQRDFNSDDFLLVFLEVYI